jgi:hypothetical protein
MNKSLLVGFVCLSLGAFAQSGADASQTLNGKSTSAQQDAASGQVSGKRVHQPASGQNQGSGQNNGKANGNKTGADSWNASSGKAKSSNSSGSGAGKTSTDDWNTQSKQANNGSNGGTHVATGDVNGDGHAKLTATKSSGHATESNAVLTNGSNAQGSRDAASGLASGKRQHQPLTVKKEVDSSSPKTENIQKETDASSPK